MQRPAYRHIQMSDTIYTDVIEMAKMVVRRRTGSRVDVPPRARGSRTGWVRKNVAMDQQKLDAARRTLGVGTETEAIDLALDFVTFRQELARGIAAVRRSGGIDDILERRRKV